MELRVIQCSWGIFIACTLVIILGRGEAAEDAILPIASSLAFWITVTMPIWFFSLATASLLSGLIHISKYGNKACGNRLKVYGTAALGVSPLLIFFVSIWLSLLPW
ncbi:hypothetical protein [Microbulbifer variabilis]|uniref:hypothetical protein n=1 Tax=Microbulbifer variabilis TaxID=266805 RepID=UPI001CFE931C|nr:hypothetical protein [Microbulbifer variabilis]